MYSQDLPIHSVVQDLQEALGSANFFVIVAPPGAGKSTALALDLMSMVQGQIWQTQPRRVAALGVATRMAQCLGQKPGEQVGYRVRMDSAVGPQTQVHVVTEGVLGRLLREDPELSGIDMVLLDEFHERSLQGDLNLALLREVQASLRPDLKILILSATPDPKWSKVWPDARLIHSEGRAFPVEIHYAQTRVEDLEKAMVQVLADAPLEGSTLVFLPGQGEIQRLKARLENDLRFEGRVLRTLYGQMPLSDQAKVVAEVLPGRIVLATNIAETSLTLRDVVWVVDSGVERFALHEPHTGLSRYEKRRISLASATQRAGRAGRVQAGHAFRMWTRAEESMMRPAQVAEILDGDLSALVLELAAWNYSVNQLEWVDIPPVGALAAAKRRLQKSGLIFGDQLSPLGAKALEWPFEPRLGLLVEISKQMNQKDLGLLVAVVLSERDYYRGAPSSDLLPRLKGLLIDKPSSSFDLGGHARLRAWLKNLGVKIHSLQLDVDLLQEILLKVFPERVAGTRKLHGSEYIMAMGRGACLSDMDPLKSEPFLMVLEASYGQKLSQIRLALPIDESLLRKQAQWNVDLEWDSSLGFWLGKNQLGFGSVCFESKLQKTFPKQVLIEWISENWKTLNFKEIPLLKSLEMDWSRLEFAAPYLGIDLPEMASDFWHRWIHALELYWPSEVQAQNADLAPADLWQCLLGYEGYREWNRRFPQKWQSPAGHWIEIIYEDAPLVSAPLQDFYGVEVHPALEAGSLPIKVSLLSPARRPLQITLDLPGFWRGSYEQVRKEMKGRYPRHHWPDEPWAAVAGHRIKNRPPQS